LRSRATFKELRTPFLVERLSTQPRTKTQLRKWLTVFPRKWRRVSGLLSDAQIARFEAEGLL
jgi:sRNA-binding protein